MHDGTELTNTAHVDTAGGLVPPADDLRVLHEMAADLRAQADLLASWVAAHSPVGGGS